MNATVLNSNISLPLAPIPEKRKDSSKVTNLNSNISLPLAPIPEERKGSSKVTKERKNYLADYFILERLTELFFSKDIPHLKNYLDNCFILERLTELFFSKDITHLKKYSGFPSACKTFNVIWNKSLNEKAALFLKSSINSIFNTCLTQADTEVTPTLVHDLLDIESHFNKKKPSGNKKKPSGNKKKPSRRTLDAVERMDNTMKTSLRALTINPKNTACFRSGIPGILCLIFIFSAFIAGFTYLCIAGIKEIPRDTLKALGSMAVVVCSGTGLCVALTSDATKTMVNNCIGGNRTNSSCLETGIIENIYNELMDPKSYINDKLEEDSEVDSSSETRIEFDFSLKDSDSTGEELEETAHGLEKQDPISAESPSSGEEIYFSLKD